MKRLDAPMLTPLYVKTSPDDAWPDEPVFYVLSREGVWLCRNDRFFRSAVRARRPPSELASFEESLTIDYPPIAGKLLEQAIGFFTWAYHERGAESVLLLAWNEALKEVVLIAPLQVATSYRNARGDVYAESVRYEFPYPLPEGVVIFGDIHSHCDLPAYASSMDQQDEVLFNGLHIVAGRLDEEPPHWHVEAAIDGVRFRVNREDVLAEYRQRDPDFPSEWGDKHSVELTGFKGPVVSPPPLTSVVTTYPYDSNRDGNWPSSPSPGKTTWGGKPVSNDEVRSSQPPLFPPANSNAEESNSDEPNA